MSMVYWWIPPGGVPTDLGDAVIRLGTIEGLATSGEIGQAASSTLIFDNPGGTLNLTGLRPFWVVENTAPAGNQVIWHGYIGDRHWRRDASRSMITGADSVIDVALTDDNGILSWNLLTQASANRPAETAAARGAWLLAQANCPAADYGKVHWPTLNMDANDYRQQTVADVLGDIAAQSGYNFFGYWDETNDALGLWLDDPDSANDSSTLVISNVLVNIDNVTTFYPFVDGDLGRSPSRVASGVSLPFARGSVYVQNATTKTNFASVDRTAPMANVKTSAKATAAANRFLADNATEDDRIVVTTRQPAALVNLAKPGQVIAVQFTHLPGYASSLTGARILQRKVAQPQEDDTTYTITYDLSPGPAAPVPPFTGSAFAGLLSSANSGGSAGILYFTATGDTWPAGWFAEPSVSGHLTFVEGGSPYYSITTDVAMTVRIECQVAYVGVSAPGEVIAFEVHITRGASTIFVGADSATAPGGFFTGDLRVDVHNVALQAGDVVTAVRTAGSGWTAGVGAAVNETYLRVGRGTHVWNTGTYIWIGP